MEPSCQPENQPGRAGGRCEDAKGAGRPRLRASSASNSPATRPGGRGGPGGSIVPGTFLRAHLVSSDEGGERGQGVVDERVPSLFFSLSLDKQRPSSLGGLPAAAVSGPGCGTTLAWPFARPSLLSRDAISGSLYERAGRVWREAMMSPSQRHSQRGRHHHDVDPLACVQRPVSVHPLRAGRGPLSSPSSHACSLHGRSPAPSSAQRRSHSSSERKPTS